MNRAVLFLIGILLLPINCFANGLLVFDPTNFFKNALSAKNSASSLLNQAKQLKNEIHLLEYEAKNTRSLAASEFRDVSSLLNDAVTITRQGKAISYTMKDLDLQFRKQFPNYAKQTKSVNYQQAYEQWNGSTMDTLSNSLQSIGIIASDVNREQSLLQTLKHHAAFSKGQLQALQATNEINTESIHQLQQLKQIIAAQANAQTAYMAQQTSEETYQEKSVSDLVQSMPSDFPDYKDNLQLGQVCMDTHY